MLVPALLAGLLVLAGWPSVARAQGTWELDLPAGDEEEAPEGDEEPVGTAADVPAADEEPEEEGAGEGYGPVVTPAGEHEEGKRSGGTGIEWGVVPDEPPPGGKEAGPGRPSPEEAKTPPDRDAGEGEAPRGPSGSETKPQPAQARGQAGAADGGVGDAAAGVEAATEGALGAGAEAAAPVESVDLVLPDTSPTDVLGLWQDRRTDLLEMDPSAAREKEEALTRLRETLALENLLGVAQALVREGRRDFEEGHQEEALRKARLAVTLAPSAPQTWRFLARALLVTKPGSVGEIASALWASVQRSVTVLPARRALQANLLTLFGVALVGTLLLFLGVTFLGRLRLFLHDFHHRLPRGTSLLQSSVVVLLFLLLPSLLGLGLVPAILLPAIAAWPYEGKVRRGLLLLTVLVVGLLPPAARQVVAMGRFWETRAADVWRVEYTGSWGPALDRLRARAERGEASYAERFALARAEKRLGHLERAERLYEEAQGQGGASDAALYNNLGVVRFALGDLEGAKESFQKALSLDGRLAAAYHNLAKVYFKDKLLSKGQVARRKAMDLDRALVDAHPDTEPRLNVALVDVALDDARLAKLLDDPSPPDAARQVRAHLASLLPEVGAPALALAALAVVLLGGLLRERLGVAEPCARCGRPVCRRCDREARGSLCGQCVNVFERQDLVAPEVRLAKERAIRRRRVFLDRLELLCAILLPGLGALLARRLLLGLLLLGVTLFAVSGILLWNGPFPDALWVEAGWPTWRLLGSGLLLLLSFTLSIWTTLRR